MNAPIEKQNSSDKKLNCWEVMMCGREPGGKKVSELGVCSAAADASFHGINDGECGGRICWAVAGTLCGGCTQGTFIEKRSSCLDCDFYCMVQEEEGLADRRTKFLQFLQSEDRSPFFEKMTYLHVKAGQRFVVQGQVEDNAYIIQRGSCLVIVEKDGELHPVDHYGEGEIVGGLGILTGEPRRAHVEAETDMDLWVMTRKQFDEITEKDPDLLNFITELVADRLDSHRPTAYRTIGKYVATDIIGRGAFSIVYRGRHHELGLPVVIKMMRHDLALYPDIIENFKNEAKTIAGLNHPNIVKVYDFDERYRTLFIIMEHVAGNSLKEMIQRLRRLPPMLVADFVYQISSALDYAHQQGVIHRDINPSNIIVQPNDQIKILDFGLSCPIGTEDFGNTGTAQYMAPEQIEAAPVDGRTDIYALGITAYEMLTGTLPFQHSDLNALLEMHTTHDVPNPADIVAEIPRELNDFIRKAGKCDPSKRYFTMREAIEELEPLISKKRQANGFKRLHEGRTSTLFMAYTNEQQAELQRLIEVFCTQALSLGVQVELSDFTNI